MSLGVVIPTRNRASLAIAACDSLLQQTGCRYQVFVSDNSTNVEERQRLSDYCSAANSPRLTYLKPNEPLAMSAHWDWALRTAMDRSDATHFSVHYDRRITKPGQLAPVCRAIGLFPDDVMTFFFDLVIRSRGQVGRVAANVGRPAVFGADLTRRRDDRQGTDHGDGTGVPGPVELRGAARGLRPHPGAFRDDLRVDRTRFLFTYRFCATHDHYVHYDRCVGIAYGFDRSTGFGFARDPAATSAISCSGGGTGPGSMRPPSSG